MWLYLLRFCSELVLSVVGLLPGVELQDPSLLDGRDPGVFPDGQVLFLTNCDTELDLLVPSLKKME